MMNSENNNENNKAEEMLLYFNTWYKVVVAKSMWNYWTNWGSCGIETKRSEGNISKETLEFFYKGEREFVVGRD